MSKVGFVGNGTLEQRLKGHDGLTYDDRWGENVRGRGSSWCANSGVGTDTAEEARVAGAELGWGWGEPSEQEPLQQSRWEMVGAWPWSWEEWKDSRNIFKVERTGSPNRRGERHQG